MASGKLKATLGMHMVRYACDLLVPGTQKSALSQLKNKLMNWADFLHAGSDGIICFDHQSCLVCLAFKYWGSTVVVLHSSCYLLRCLLNFGLPQSLSHGQYCLIFPNFAFLH